MVPNPNEIGLFRELDLNTIVFKIEMKRKLDDEFIQECSKNFKANPANVIAKNAINSVGSQFATINSTRLNQINHNFTYTVKSPTTKATNQKASGRCWMFASLNIFRHLLIKALNMDNFEFSEVYLFFYDKLERANTYLTWFVDNENPDDRELDYMLTAFNEDGGWFNTFANLADKYGLVPASAMKETFQSDDSDEMNKIIKERLDYGVNEMKKCKNKDKVRSETMKHIYNILVKFLGEPPTRFEFTYKDNEGDVVNSKRRFTPHEFKLMVSPFSFSTEFVALVDIPLEQYPYYHKYTIKNTSNTVEGKNCTVYNLPTSCIVSAIIKSIKNGVGVWFSGDVNHSFNWFHSTLDDKLDDHSSVFGNIKGFNKGERILLKNIGANHAMLLTGFNLSKGCVSNWQVENSWGFQDSDTPGQDGFLNMSHSWFEKYVHEVVVHVSFLPRTLKLDTFPEVICNTWDYLSCALKTGYKIPQSYLSLKK